MRRARTVLLAAVTATTVALAGCSATVTGTPTAQGASGATTDAGSGGAGATTTAAAADAETWTNNVCGSLLPFVKAATSKPDIDSSNTRAAVKSISDYLGQAVSSVDQSLADLDAVGPSPVSGGEQIVSKLKDTLTTVRTSFAKSKDIIDKVNPNDPRAVASQLPQALAPLQELSDLKNPLADLEVDPALDAAAEKAPNCQAISKFS